MHSMTRIMIVGATGLVGSELLALALAHPAVSHVVAPVRRTLPAHARLLAPVVDFEHLPGQADWWAVDVLLCALGTTRRDAGSAEAFIRIDHDYPMAVARLARNHGVPNLVVVSAAGADAGSRLLYPRSKGLLEDGLREAGFDSITLLRPSLLLGRRVRVRPLEQLAMRVLPTLAPLLPARYRPVRASAVAAAMLAAALAPQPGVRVVEAVDIGSLAVCAPVH